MHSRPTSKLYLMMQFSVERVNLRYTCRAGLGTLQFSILFDYENSNKWLDIIVFNGSVFWRARSIMPKAIVQYFYSVGFVSVTVVLDQLCLLNGYLETTMFGYLLIYMLI